MKLAIGGDLSVTKYSSRHFEEVDARGAFNGLVDIFQQCDRVILNLECALTDRENAIKKCGPNLKGPVRTADTLRQAGVTDCTLSNNHIFDFGIEGLEDTLRQLDRVGIRWTGIGENVQASRKNHIIVQDGITISVVNVCEHEYTYALEDRTGARPFDEFETMEDIRQAKRSADYVIVIYHGGKEHCKYPSPRLRKACREMVLCGADVVLCQHSHCIGCYEKFEDAHILYGQGNFHFVGYRDTEGWDTGLLAVLQITKEKLDIEFVPVVMLETAIDTAKGEERQKILDGLWERSEQLHNGQWRQEWHAFCLSMYEPYKKSICGYSFGDDLDRVQVFAHYLDCEAHTDVWRELFPTWNHTNEKP